MNNQRISLSIGFILLLVEIASCSGNSPTSTNKVSQLTVKNRTSTIASIFTHESNIGTVYLEFACPECYINYDMKKWIHYVHESGLQRLKNIENNLCEIGEMGGSGMDPNSPQRMEYIGKHNWHIIETLDIYLYIFEDRDLIPEGYSVIFLITRQEEKSVDEKCLRDAYEVLATISVKNKADPGNEPLPTFTVKPPFLCPNAPAPANFVVDDTFIVKRNVYLRSSPKKLENNIIRLLYPGTEGTIIDGPICGEFEGGAYIYWKVQLINNEIGWVAEADSKGPYIEETMRYGP